MDILKTLGIEEKNRGVCTGSQWYATSTNGHIDVTSPVDGRFLASVNPASEDDYRQCSESAMGAFAQWRAVPGPKRGEVVRQIGDAFR